MKNITLIIPAKEESASLRLVLEELKKFNFTIKIILKEDDVETINSIKELYEIGVDYYFEQAGLHFIEWPDKFINELPVSDFDIYFLSLESSRLVKIHKKI